MDTTAHRQLEHALRTTEARFRTIIEHANAGLVQTDAQGRMTLVNERWCQMLGYTERDLLGRSIAEVTDPESLADTMAAVDRLAAGGPDFVIEKNYRRRDGTVLPATSTVSALRDEHGAYLGLVAVIIDATERRRFEDDLRQRDAWIAAAQAAGSVGFFDYHFPSDTSTWSEGLARLFGISLAEYDGTWNGWMRRVMPEDAERVRDAVSAAAAAGQDLVEYEFRAMRPDGTTRWLAARARFQYTPDGTAVRLTGVHVDVTSRKALESALRDSEAQFRAFMDNSPARAWLKDDAGRYVFVNRAVRKALGPAADALIGRTDEEMFGPHQADVYRANDRLVRERGLPIEVHESLPQPDGLHHQLVIKFPVRNADGRVSVGGMAIDVTPQREAEEALRRSEEQLASVSDAVPALISYVDLEGRYRFCNQTYTQWFGVSTDQMVGRHMRDVLGEDAWRSIEPHMHAAIAGQTADFEAEAHYARGGTRWIHAIYTPDRDGYGRVRGVVVMVSDISARKHAEEALREADRRKDEFLAVLAHELRNPLAPIRTGLELLRISGSAPGALERVRPILERQVAHMVRLIDDLLDVSRITSGKIQLQRQPTPLADLVGNAVEANRSAIEGAGLTIDIALPDTPCLLDVDPTRFVQVLSNLLHNATKFTHRGGRISVAARVVSEGGRPSLVLTVRDTGIGIPAEMLPRVFDLFVQGTSGPGGAAGLGIGLALARQLVELHCGRLEVESEGHGRGSAFTIRMPALTWASLPPADDTGPESPTPLATRVLIIDDNVDAAEMLAAVVAAMGAKVRTATNGPDGIRDAAAFKPDVILLDIGMPDMDGYETCRSLRASPAGRDCVIFALTGWGQDHDRQRALAGGFDAHLTKPADPQVLASLLRNPREGRRHASS